MVARADIVKAARSWLGVPWRHQGRSKAGLDCAGLVVVVAHGLGLSDHDERGYGRRPERHSFIHHFAQHMDALNPKDVRPGDVILFREKARPYTCHAALVAEDGAGRLTIIHAYARRRMVVEEPLTTMWGLHTHAFRFRGIEEA